MMKALSDCAKYESRLTSSVAPRLSLLETNRYLMPALDRRSSIPEPSSDG